MHICMEWRSLSFDWNMARALLIKVEEGSLSAAVRALGLTQPTLSHQVAPLEKELGAVLFERVGRGVELTPGGAELLEHVRAMGDAVTRCWRYFNAAPSNRPPACRAWRSPLWTTFYPDTQFACSGTGNR